MDAGTDDLAALGVLAEPQRARIYDHLAAADEALTRQEVAGALGMGRTLAAFHFDKLEQAGLIAPVPDQAASGRPGRPAQRYRVAREEVSASVPPRRYQLLAEVLLLAAGEQRPGEPLEAAATRVARRRGRDLVVELGGAGVRGATARQSVTGVLARLGYEPSDEGTSVILTNCPFHRLRVLDTQLVCSVNDALVAGCLDALGDEAELTSRLRPCPTSCCVVLERSA